MALKIVRNDITKMATEAIVNTANDHPTVGTGCDHAIYAAAGMEKLLEYRKANIGFVPEGDAFITPGFNLNAKYIIHAVSPHYRGGDSDEEAKLRSCYQKSLQLAKENGIRSIAFPLISTGGFGYPKEEGLRVAVDEINAFLLHDDMEIYLVVFGDETSSMGKKLYPDLEEYIDRKYVADREVEEYGCAYNRRETLRERKSLEEPAPLSSFLPRSFADSSIAISDFEGEDFETSNFYAIAAEKVDFLDAAEEHEEAIKDRLAHAADTFSEYLMFLIEKNGMAAPDVYKAACVDKKVFSKIKNDPNYHPQKLTALCLCIGAKLNMDDAADLLKRAGYALSNADKTDIIFSYFIEKGIYDIVDLDIMLEEHGLPCIIK